MATIENNGNLKADFFKTMCDEELIAQNLVQQGAIHAISFLLQNGCTEENALDMLSSLRANAKNIRNEAKRRGSNIFNLDQTCFN